MKVKTEEVISVLLEILPEGTPEIVDYDKHLYDYGLDSLDTVTLLLAIEKKYGFTIADSEVGELITANSIARYVQSRVSGD